MGDAEDELELRKLGFGHISDNLLPGVHDNVVHMGGGNPRDWLPQKGKVPSLGTIQYVSSYCADEDEATAILDHVFPDALALMDEVPTIRSRYGHGGE